MPPSVPRKECSVNSCGHAQCIPMALRKLTYWGRLVFSMHTIQTIENHEFVRVALGHSSLSIHGKTHCIH